MISSETHRGFMDGLAALSARFWTWRDEVGLMTMEERLRFFAPDNIAAEAAVEDPPVPIAVAMQGWPRLAARSPALAELLAAIHADPTPLADAMRETPMTFLHGDWKMGNLGMHPDGRTILLDWAYPGAGPRAGISRGISRSTASACRQARRRPSTRYASRWGGAASRPMAGSNSNSTSVCSG